MWATARPETPVVPIEGMGDHAMYLVLTHDLVDRVLRDAETFSSVSNAAGIGQVMGPMIVGMDGDEHRRTRGIVAKAFRPSAMARWEHEIVVPVLADLLDRIAPAGRADLVHDLTAKLPVRVIAAVLGAEAEDYDRIHEWAEAINLGPTNLEVSLPAAQALRDYLEPIVAERRRSPGDDLISDIVQGEVDGHRLDDEHVYGVLRLLFPAGAETTFRVLGSTLFALLAQPQWLDRLRRDRSLVETVVEESLRWETAVTVVSRVATRDVELGGVNVPAGSGLLVSVGAANRDPAHTDDPNRWDPDRPMRPSLAFGTGRHQCLGMHLARMELRVAVNGVLDRLPNLRLDPDADPPSITGFAFRGPDRLPVLFDAHN